MVDLIRALYEGWHSPNSVDKYYCQNLIGRNAIANLVANVLPNLGIAEMARVQVQLALRDYVKSAV